MILLNFSNKTFVLMSKSIQVWALAICMSIFLCACTKDPAIPLLPTPAVIAVAPFNQPIYTTQLLAGNIPKEQSEADPIAMLQYDELFKEKLEGTARNYIFLTQKDIARNVALDSKGRENVLSTWAHLAQSVGADYIIVPQILDFEEREGDPSYVRKPARLITDIFLIEAIDPETGSTDGSLLVRSHYREVSFIHPNLTTDGDDYVTPRQKLPIKAFAKEAINKAIRDFSL